MRKANPTAQIQDMPKVDLITIVKMVSKLVPRVELMSGGHEAEVVGKY